MQAGTAVSCSPPRPHCQHKAWLSEAQVNTARPTTPHILLVGTPTFMLLPLGELPGSGMSFLFHSRLRCYLLRDNDFLIICYSSIQKMLRTC